MVSIVHGTSSPLLQDIDAEFSKMQKVLSNRILPAFKRYSIGTEPVREAAKVCACGHSIYSTCDICAFFLVLDVLL